MEWAEENGDDYIFGLAGNAALDALVAETADNLRFHHASSSEEKLRTYTSFMYQASSWTRPRKVVARLECSLQPERIVWPGSSTSTVVVTPDDRPRVAPVAGKPAKDLRGNEACQEAFIPSCDFAPETKRIFPGGS
jgi:hypothetical protein